MFCTEMGGAFFAEVIFLLWSSGSGLDELMNAEEKEKLYTAIGYSGSSHNLALPKQVGLNAALVFMVLGGLNFL